jgi:hypothetical protein
MGQAQRTHRAGACIAAPPTGARIRWKIHGREYRVSLRREANCSSGPVDCVERGFGCGDVMGPLRLTHPAEPRTSRRDGSRLQALKR